MERFTVDPDALPQMLVVRSADAEDLTKAINDGISQIKQDGGTVYEIRFSPSVADAQGSLVQFMTAVVLYSTPVQSSPS